MVKIEIYLTPPLTDVLGKLMHIVEGIYFPLLDLNRSVDGYIKAVLGALHPDLTYVVVFPEQTISGITYERTESKKFNLYYDHVLHVTLTPVTPPPPPIPPEEKTKLPLMAIPPLVAGIILVYLLPR